MEPFNFKKLLKLEDENNQNNNDDDTKKLNLHNIHKVDL